MSPLSTGIAPPTICSTFRIPTHEPAVMKKATLIKVAAQSILRNKLRTF